MSARLTSEFWVSAFLKRCQLEGAYALVGRRGAREAGAIMVVIDRLDGTSDLYAPAPQSEQRSGFGGRTFERVRERVDAEAIRQRIAREVDFDSDLWVVTVEDRQGRSFLSDD